MEGGLTPATTEKLSECQLDIVQCNSILTLFTGDSIRFHRLRVQFYKTAVVTTTTFCHQLQAQVTCASDNGLQIGDFHDCLLRLQRTVQVQVVTF